MGFIKVNEQEDAFFSKCLTDRMSPLPANLWLLNNHLLFRLNNYAFFNTYQELGELLSEL